MGAVTLTDLQVRHGQTQNAMGIKTVDSDCDLVRISVICSNGRAIKEKSLEFTPRLNSTQVFIKPTNEESSL